MAERKVCRPGGMDLTRRVLKWARLPAGAAVLDVGCGAGATVAELRRLGFDAVGIDPAPPPGDNALMVGRAEALPFEEGRFAVVLMECSLSKVKDPKKALEEAKRVLAPRGTLLVTDLYAAGKPKSFTGTLGRVERWQDIRDMASECGFEPAYFEGCTEVLPSFYAQLIFEQGPEGFYAGIGATEGELKAAGCGYFFAAFTAPGPPLDRWVLRRAGLAVVKPGTEGIPAGTKQAELSAEALADWQLAAAQKTAARAAQNSRWWREHLAKVALDGPAGRQWLEGLPFTTPQMLAEHAGQMLCVPLGQVARLRTMPTSGTVRAKRIGFSNEDMASTVDFFAVGMGPLVPPGQAVAVFMPGGRPGSITQLLARGLEQLGARAIPMDNTQTAEDAARAAKGAWCYVGPPASMFYLCRKMPHLRPKTVLLSADYVSPAVVAALEDGWCCRVFTHYGLTETTYGLAVQCGARAGQHLRAADFLVEVVHPDTGQALPPGQVGELVLTSLRPRALPLLRYRTGDIGSLEPGPCPCGSPLPRLGPVLGRAANLRRAVNIHRLDDVLFALPQVHAYRAVWVGETLKITVDGDKIDESSLPKALGCAVTVQYDKINPFTEDGKRRIDGEPME